MWRKDSVHGCKHALNGHVISALQVEEAARCVATQGSALLVELRRLFAVEDIPDSLKVTIAMAHWNWATQSEAGV